jgi:hypothetical protein
MLSTNKLLPAKANETNNRSHAVEILGKGAPTTIDSDLLNGEALIFP